MAGLADQTVDVQNSANFDAAFADLRARVAMRHYLRDLEDRDGLKTVALWPGEIAALVRLLEWQDTGLELHLGGLLARFASDLEARYDGAHGGRRWPHHRAG